jgi:hypothetical protein
MKKFLVIGFFALLLVAIHLNSRPQYSLLQSFGTDCSNCHFNVQGGGVRTPGGWMSRNSITMIPADFMNDLFTTDSWWDDKIVVGLDSRMQIAKWPAPGQGTEVPIGTTEYQFMAMQLTPYLTFQPLSWLALEAQYNIAYDLYEDKRFIAQQPFAASLYIMPGENLPQLRIGYFQPTMSMKWDDHTLLGHQFYGAKGRFPVIPIDYAELGAQIDYEVYFDGFGGLSMSGGGFSANNMAQYTTMQLKDPDYASLPINDTLYKMVSVVDSNTVSLVGRIMFSPEINWDFTTFVGATGFLNGDYYIANVFLGFGMADKFSFLLEYTDSEKDNARRAISWLGEFTYQIHEAFLPYIRAERQLTREVTEPAANYTNQFILGAHVFIFPYVDLVPEYRIVDREWIDGYHASFAFQIHIWY